MKRILEAILICFFMVALAWAANEWVIVVHRKSVARLRGTATIGASHTPVESVVLDLYDNPGATEKDWETGTRPLGSVTTDSSGKFDFGEHPRGRYEIRAAKPPGGLHTTSHIVTLDPKRGNKQPIDFDITCCI